jgi:hypothetical protein
MDNNRYINMDSNVVTDVNKDADTNPDIHRHNIIKYTNCNADIHQDLDKYIHTFINAHTHINTNEYKNTYNKLYSNSDNNSKFYFNADTNTNIYFHVHINTTTNDDNNTNIDKYSSDKRAISDKRCSNISKSI